MTALARLEPGAPLAPRLRVLIADDERLALERLSAAVAAVDGVELVAALRDGRATAEAIANLKPDVAILDIQMPRRAGTALVRALPAEDRPEIIFLTAFETYAVEAFELAATDFILKPFSQARISSALQRARRRRDAVRLRETAGLGGEGGALWVREGRSQLRIPLAEVDWIEAAGDYVVLHTPSKTHVLRSTLSALSDELDPKLFMRIHRSAVVRLGAVREVRRDDHGRAVVKLHDGQQVLAASSHTLPLLRALGLEPRRG
jgi:DNA-binding LytR/AlgR family response regulator